MTKKLEDFFNVDNTESDAEDQLSLTAEKVVPIETTIALVHEQLTIADRIDRALPTVRGLDVEDRDLDEYADRAMESFERLMDLGYNMDDRNAGKVFEVASTMMNNGAQHRTKTPDTLGITQDTEKKHTGSAQGQNRYEKYNEQEAPQKENKQQEMSR